MTRARVDPLPAIGSLLALGTLALYLVLMRAEADRPVAWVAAALGAGAATAAYGSVGSAGYRTWALAAAAAVLGVVGMLAIFSVGLPVLVAGVLCLAGAARATSR